MATLEELQRRNQLLRIRKQTKEDFARINAERKRLTKENKELAHPYRNPFRKETRRVFKTWGGLAKNTLAKTYVHYSNYRNQLNKNMKKITGVK